MGGILKGAMDWTAGLALAVTLAGCERKYEPTVATLGDLSRGELAEGAEAFTIDLPRDCQMKSRGGSMDFEVFDVTCGGVGYVGLYAGNAADESVPRSRLLKTDWAWPSEIQVWTLEVAGDQARADRIAVSVKLGPQPSPPPSR